MVLDPQKILDWPFEPVEQTYTERDTILYALGCGLGIDPLDERQAGSRDNLICTGIHNHLYEL